MLLTIVAAVFPKLKLGSQHHPHVLHRSAHPGAVAFLMVQVCDVAECCKCLCSALCKVARSCYGPCAHASCGADLVYGKPARDAVLALGKVHYRIAELHKQ